MAGRDGAIEDMLRRARLPELIGESTWNAVAASFRSGDFDRWVGALERLIAADIGFGAVINFARASAVSAKLYGAEATLAVVPVAIHVRDKAGGRAAARFLGSIPRASEHLKDATALRLFLQAMEKLAELAPESVEPLVERIDFVLARLDAASFRAWMLAGLRSAAGDAGFRRGYFSLADESALRAFDQASSDVLFVDVERRLKAFLMALWGLRPAVRTVPFLPGRAGLRRAVFDGLIIRVPEAFGGLHGQDAVAHYRAVLSHIGAHMVHSRAKFPVGTLKPLQVALVSLIEDARVEKLAARDYPGLGRLWARYHVARPQGGLTAEILMLRLARALIDPDYVDSDPWVMKGTTMFFDHRSQWDDPAISRRIGGLLGNDIGQMRIQFDARAYVVEPSYRDDHGGLWDYGEPPPEQAETAETVLESVRIEQREDAGGRRKAERTDDGGPANRAATQRAVDADVGLPVARYPEWDYIAAAERAEWTTTVEYEAKPAPPEAARSLIEAYPGVAERITALVRNAKISRPERLKRQNQGDRIDLDAAVRAAIARRAGVRPDPRVYETRTMRARDLAVLVLLDISESTRDRIRDTTSTVLQVERTAVALLAQAMAGLGDPFAVTAFSSNGREEVRSYRVKGFDQRYDDAARARLAGLRGGLSTRLGAALRHAGAEVAGQRSHRRLILVLSDGEPSDIDVADERYLVEDARKAVQDFAHRGIDVFCVGLDGGGRNYLMRIFGRRGFVMISRVESLPEKLPMLYFRLTG